LNDILVNIFLAKLIEAITAADTMSTIPSQLHGRRSQVQAEKLVGQRNLPWLFSAPVDLLAFVGSAAVALGLLILGVPLGLLDSDTPDWLWIGTILMIDVAHVYATGFRVYFDPRELRRRPWLYALTPILALVVSSVIYGQSSALFWRLLAYLAVFHFVRQQYGWVALYRAREGDHGRCGWWIDAVAIYSATLYPLIYWHTHHRNFSWFVQGDFLALSPAISAYAAIVYWTALLVYCLRSVLRAIVYRRLNPGKDLVLLTTAICWHVGIISCNSDYAFTVTNVITHGVPYMVLIQWYRLRTAEQVGSVQRPNWVKYLAILWALAYAEEFLWDVGVWHERAWLFGTSQDWSSIQLLIVPLLAVPQITHYVLDGFIWKRRDQSALMVS
jgi:hypothetical protein